ncbi:hypothetical protein [Paenibacillus sp. FJAT-26967]|uniref:hypothetical protein n=1 Tax=Paenibacillus sp. FJAT-26967 TaxID=1729690 RepID=UPI0020A39FC8|nr:hypothetical protein [Paenibacillus sp. FJAT-26967]
MNLEQIEKEGTIEGFFLMKFQEEEYGLYHNEELGEVEEGFDIISTWFDNLLEVVIKSEFENYIALKDIESFNTWIEFIFKGRNISVSVVQSNDSISDYLVTLPLKNRLYPEWKGIVIKQDDFKKEVIRKTKNYIADVSSLNTYMMQSQRINKLLKLLDKLKNN